MCWSSPVIATTMNIPLKNCLKKFWVDMKSSNTKMRLWLSAATADTASPTDKPRWSITWYIIIRSATIMQSVWKVSVHTMVFIPPRRV